MTVKEIEVQRMQQKIAAKRRNSQFEWRNLQAKLDILFLPLASNKKSKRNWNNIFEQKQVDDKMIQKEQLTAKKPTKIRKKILKWNKTKIKWNSVKLKKPKMKYSSKLKNWTKSQNKICESDRDRLKSNREK